MFVQFEKQIINLSNVIEFALHDSYIRFNTIEKCKSDLEVWYDSKEHTKNVFDKFVEALKNGTEFIDMNEIMKGIVK
jgi:hypothetical protein